MVDHRRDIWSPCGACQCTAWGGSDPFIGCAVFRRGTVTPDRLPKVIAANPTGGRSLSRTGSGARLPQAQGGCLPHGTQFRLLPRYAIARFTTHMFAMRCRNNEIKRRLTQINHPCANGQVEQLIERGARDAALC